MPTPIKPAVAIKRFIEQGTDEKVGAQELAGLKSASTPEEWSQFAADSAAALDGDFVVQS